MGDGGKPFNVCVGVRVCVTIREGPQNSLKWFYITDEPFFVLRLKKIV